MRIVATIVCLFLAGCANQGPSKETVQYITNTYPDSALRAVQTDTGTWNVFESRKNSTVLVIANKAASQVIGAAHGASLGLAEGTPKEGVFRAAANALFSQEKRNCQAHDGRKISLNSYEFEYSCNQ